jgi:hypothetical protein
MCDVVILLGCGADVDTNVSGFKIKIVFFSETSVPTYESKRCRNPEEQHCHPRRREIFIPTSSI